MIPYNEERCCVNEVALQEDDGIWGGIPPEEREYAIYDYYCDVRDGKADILLEARDQEARG